MKFNNEKLYLIHSVVVYGILTLVLIPTTISKFVYAVIDLHWLGSEAAYDYWINNNFLWGETIIQNIGPLGFIHFPLSFTGIMDYVGTNLLSDWYFRIISSYSRYVADVVHSNSCMFCRSTFDF